MGFLLKAVVAACLVFGFHYAVKQGVWTAVTAELGEQPQNVVPAPLIVVDPDAMRQAQEVGRAAQVSAANQAAAVSRIAKEGAEAQLRQMNRDAARMATPQYSHFPGQR